MKLEIVNDRLVRDGRPVEFIQSPNVGGRIEPTLIVIHDTADRLQPYDSVNWFKQKKSKVSAHLVIGRDGQVIQMVEFDVRGQHAGSSTWRGKKDCNGFSIGIEIDNPGRLTPRGDGKAVAWYGEVFDVKADGLVYTPAGCTTHGKPCYWLPYTPAQIAVVEAICRRLMIAYPKIVDVAAHFEISPGRKADCGPHYPLAALKALAGDRRVQSVPAPTTLRLAQTRLAALGYEPGPIDGLQGPRTRSALRSFQEQNGILITGELDLATSKAIVDPAAKAMPAPIASTPAAAPGEAVQKRTSELGIAFNLADSVSSLDQALSVAEKSQAMSSRFDVILNWATSPQGLVKLAILGLLLFAWFSAGRIDWRAHCRRVGLSF